MFHKGKYYVTFKRGYEENKKDVTVIIDKIFASDSVKITISDDDDPAFLCVVSVNRFDYEELKKQQGLLIDFDNFPSQLVRLFQQCASNNMFLLIQQTNPVQYFLEIVEHNEFRRLVHLSLKTGPATDADIKQHMADTIIDLKKSLSTLKSSAASSDAIWNDKCINLERKVLDLSHALTKMEEDKLRKLTEYQESLKHERDKLMQEKVQWQRNIEHNKNTQHTIAQENLSKKDKQIDELNAICKQLRDDISHLEFQLREKTQRVNVLEKEVQKTHIEEATLKARNASLEKDLTEKEKENGILNTRCSYLEKTIKENTEAIKELNVSIQLIKREKDSLEERLSLSEALATKNNEAAHSTSEQLLKANQIISKQNTDLIEMKEKLLCRTAIALEQEKVIEKNTKEMEVLKAEVRISNQNLEKLKMELNSLMEKYETNENALKDRDETIKNNNMVIQWLHKKMEENCPPNDQQQKHGIHTATSSTPYFLPRNKQNSASQEMSDMSINFYATSRSNLDDNSGPPLNENSANVGLDPKYLKPASDENKVGQSKGAIKAKSTECFNPKSGKENQIIDLPKVDYREKKSSRQSIHKLTPVSAYFP